MREREDFDRGFRGWHGWGIRLKVGAVVQRLLSHDPFPTQSSILEVQEKGEFESSDVQIPEHLRDVRLCKC
jgi:hypothetical protein